MNRPVHVKAGVVLAALTILLNLFSAFAWRAVLGDAWVFVLFLKFLTGIVLAIFLVHIFYGKGWARIVILCGWVLVYGQAGWNDVRVLLHPLILASFSCSFAAVLLWFSAPSVRWFREMSTLRNTARASRRE